jgi:hypothetical protein
MLLAWLLEGSVSVSPTLSTLGTLRAKWKKNCQRKKAPEGFKARFT